MRRFRRLRHSGRAAALTASPLNMFALAIGGLILLDSSLPDLVSLMDGAEIVAIGCTPVYANEIVLVVDASRSMDTDARQEILQEQISRINEREIETAQYTVVGMGTTARSRNLMSKLEEIFDDSKHAEVNAIFVLSDFVTSNENKMDRTRLPPWQTDPESLHALRALLMARGVRLYLASVDRTPSTAMPMLMQIARDSGGGEILLRGLEANSTGCPVL